MESELSLEDLETLVGVTPEMAMSGDYMAPFLAFIETSRRHRRENLKNGQPLDAATIRREQQAAFTMLDDVEIMRDRKAEELDEQEDAFRLRVSRLVLVKGRYGAATDCWAFKSIR